MHLCTLPREMASNRFPRFVFFLPFRSCVIVIFVKGFLLHLQGDKELKLPDFYHTLLKKKSHSYRPNASSPTKHYFSLSEKYWILGFCQQLIVFWKRGNDVLWGCTYIITYILGVARGQFAIYRMVWQPLKHLRYLGYGLCVRGKLTQWLVLWRRESSCGRREMTCWVLKGWILKMSLGTFYNLGDVLFKAVTIRC